VNALILNTIKIGKLTPNPFVKGSKILVSKVNTTENLREDILKSINLIGGFRKVINQGDNVLVKPNFNSADSPPASTDPEFLTI